MYYSENKPKIVNLPFSKKTAHRNSKYYLKITVVRGTKNVTFNNEN